MKEQISYIPWADIEPSKENRPDRSGMDPKSIGELATSIAEQGLVQPIVLRKHPDPKSKKKYEIVAGERRWTAFEIAAKKKKDLGDVPSIVRNLSDEEVREQRLIENVQRENIHEIEEAKGYRQLLDQRGAEGKPKYNVESLAKKVGKSPAFVYARLKLLRLPEFAQDAYFAGKLNASVALLLCRIPDPKLAKKAAFEVLDPWGNTAIPEEERIQRVLDPEHACEPMSFRKAKDHIQNKYMVRLKGAPFDPEDPDLVPAQFDFSADAVTLLPETNCPPQVAGGPPGVRTFGGKCSDCPFRTGNLKTLFADQEATDVCTNPTCFKKKKDAGFRQEAEKSKKQGLTLLKPGQVDRLLSYDKELSSSARAQYIDLRETPPGKKKTYGELLEEHIEEGTPILLAKGKRVHHLLDMEHAIPLAKKAGLKIEKPKDDGNGRWDPEKHRREEEERKRLQALRAEVVQEAVKQLEPAVLKAKDEKEFWLLIVRSVCHQFEECPTEVDFLKELKASKLPDDVAHLRWYAIQSLYCDRCVSWQGDYEPAFEDILAHFDIDLAAIDKEVTKRQAKAAKEAEAKVEAKAADDKKAEPAKK